MNYFQILVRLRNSVRVNGGGLKGIVRVSRKAYSIIRYLGWKSIANRIVGPPITYLKNPARATSFEFPQPLPIAEDDLKIGIMLHLFYPDLVEDFRQLLSNVPTPYVLMVSVVNDEAAKIAASELSSLDTHLIIRKVPNRGRDIAPFLVAFKQEILDLDIVCHVHTKKSLYTGDEKSSWRNYLLQSLLGSKPRIKWILGMFKAAPQLGIIYPENHSCVPLKAHTWLSNKNFALEVGQQLGIDVDTEAYFDFPAGSMFWARVSAIRQLFDLNLRFTSFPFEKGQTDGTLQHAIERLFTQLVLYNGMITGVLARDGKLCLSTEGDKNWPEYFEQPTSGKILAASANAKIVSFDVFDTLVVRPFLKPSGARLFLSHLVEVHYGCADFAFLRGKAEQYVRSYKQRDPNLSEIYTAMKEMPEAKNFPCYEIEQLELELEKKSLRPRTAVIDALRMLDSANYKLVAISDTYFTSDNLKWVLPNEITSHLGSVFSSCDTQWRKDTGDAWKMLPDLLGVEKEDWLHVGDNEHSDFQLPCAAGFIPPVHVLRPHALVDIIPSLSLLKPNASHLRRWQDQLWLGLVSNRLLDESEHYPDMFDGPVTLRSHQTLGYTVLGPLVLDFVSWVARIALEKGRPQVGFLSREGFFLRKAFDILTSTTGIHGTFQSKYILASRRAAGTAAILQISDLDSVIVDIYSGTLGALLETRFGDKVSKIVGSKLGAGALREMIVLPAMAQHVRDLLKQAESEIIAACAMERDAYFSYLKSEFDTESGLLVDIGYAGTIQRHLSRVLGQPLTGAYFALDARAARLDMQSGTAVARYWDGRDREPESSTIIENDLLLEAMLLSPYGQLSHFSFDSRQPRPVHLPPSSPRAIAVAMAIQEGALSFIKDACVIADQQAMDLEFDKDLVQRPLFCFGRGIWRVSGDLNGLDIDDMFTGRGNLVVNEFLN